MVRQKAAYALTRLANKDAVEPLIAALGDANENTVRAAARALGRLRDARAVEPLAKALRGGSPEIRVAAADELGTIANQRAAGVLSAATADPDILVRTTALKALAKLPAPPIEVLRSAMYDRDVGVQQTAVAALAGLRDERVVPVLAEAARIGTSASRRTAMSALVRSRWTIDPSLLVAGLKDGDPEVRRLSALHLGWRQDTRHAPTLLAALAATYSFRSLNTSLPPS